MDFGQLKFKWKNLNFITLTGIVSPQFYDDTNADWLNSWTAGFLTTCGLSNIDSACIDRREEIEIYGGLSNAPDENISISMIKDDEHAQKHIKQWNETTPPVKDFQEMCYYP